MIIDSSINNTYVRNIEEMGKGLVLIKILRKDKRPGLKYHFFYENGVKPPFDLALDPQDNQIDYCSFFIQDEKVAFKKRFFNLEFRKAIEILDEKFSFNKPNISLTKEFDVFISEEDLFVLEKNVVLEKINAYEIGANTYILFSEEDCFEGIMIKGLTELEKDQLISADVIL